MLSVVVGQEPADVVRHGVHIHRRPLRRPRGVGRVACLPQSWDRVSLAAAVGREHRRLGVDFDVCETPEWNAEGLCLALRSRPAIVVRLHSAAAQLLPFLGSLGRDERLAIRCEDALIRRGEVVAGTPPALAEARMRLGLRPARLRTAGCPVAPGIVTPPAVRPRVVYTGRLELRKGVDVLLHAAAGVLERVPEAEFVLVGADSGHAGSSFGRSMRRLADRLGITGSVRFVGHRDPERVRDELRQARVCAVPSRWESFGYAAAEGAALGRPVVASDLPSLAQVVEDGVTGRLIPVGDRRAWTDALVDLLSRTGEAERLGGAGARLVAERFAPERVAREMLQVYETAVHLHRG